MARHLVNFDSFVTSKNRFSSTSLNILFPYPPCDLRAGTYLPLTRGLEVTKTEAFNKQQNQLPLLLHTLRGCVLRTYLPVVLVWN